MKLTSFFTEEQRAQFEEAANVPINGTIQDPEGVVHDIIGDYTKCDQAWYIRSGPDERWRVNFGWTLPKGEAVAITCMLCIADG